MERSVKVHIIGAMVKGNIGTLSAQRALYRILKESFNIDLSISVTNKDEFKLRNRNLDLKIYGPILLSPGWTTRSLVHSTLWWLISVPLNTFFAMLLSAGLKPGSRKRVLDRVKQCDVLLDLNLEAFRGIPISLSNKLVKYKPSIILIHKLFLSIRIFATIWNLFLLKAVFKKKLIVGPASLGPFEGLPLFLKSIIKMFFNRFVDVLLVREPFSAVFLRRLGVRRYVQVVDTAMLDRFFPHEKFKSEDLRVGVAPANLRMTLSEEEVANYVDAHVKCLDELIEDGAKVVFLPSSHDDVIMCKSIINRMKNKDSVVIKATDCPEVYEFYIRKLTFLVTSRMHPAIIAARNFIPFISIIYDHKQLGFLRQIGLKNYSLPITRVNYKDLKSLIDRMRWNTDYLSEVEKTAISGIQKIYTKKLDSVFKTVARP